MSIDGRFKSHDRLPSSNSIPDFLRHLEELALSETVIAPGCYRGSCRGSS